MTTPSFNFQKLKSDLSKIKNLEDAKAELGRFLTDLKSIDKHGRERLERKYQQVVTQINTAQKQLDHEFDRAILLFKKTRTDAEKTLHNFKKIAVSNKNKITSLLKKKQASQPKKRARRRSPKKTSNA